MYMHTVHQSHEQIFTNKTNILTFYIWSKKTSKVIIKNLSCNYHFPFLRGVVLHMNRLSDQCIIQRLSPFGAGCGISCEQT